MTISDVGNIGELIGAAATVVTLIYVAIQIRENTSWTKRQALETVIDRVVAWGSRFNDNPQALEVYLEGLQGFESFDEVKKHKYHYIMFEILVACEAVREHNKTKSIKAETVEAIDSRMMYELRGPGARSWWEEMGRARFANDFAAHVDRLLNQNVA